MSRKCSATNRLYVSGFDLQGKCHDLLSQNINASGLPDPTSSTDTKSRGRGNQRLDLAGQRQTGPEIQRDITVNWWSLTQENGCVLLRSVRLYTVWSSYLTLQIVLCPRSLSLRLTRGMTKKTST